MGAIEKTPAMKLLDRYRKKLAQAAKDTIEDGYPAEQFVMVCMVDRPKWRRVTDWLVAETPCEREEVLPDGTAVVMGAVDSEQAAGIFCKLLEDVAEQILYRDRPELVCNLVIDGDDARIVFCSLNETDPATKPN